MIYNVICGGIIKQSVPIEESNCCRWFFDLVGGVETVYIG